LTGKTFEEPPTLVLAALLAGLQLRAQRRFRFSLPRAASSVGLAALAGLVVFTDGTQLRASRELARAQQAQRGGRMREAWLRAEPTLRDARDLGAWLWAMDLLAAAGVRARCLSVAQQALAYSPGNPLLLRHRDASRP
jgi:hypothetical protein